LTLRELSSAGSEHLPYKQRVGGSIPSAPTQKSARAFFCAKRITYIRLQKANITLAIPVKISMGGCENITAIAMV
jgi:hypothetical protein